MLEKKSWLAIQLISKGLGRVEVRALCRPMTWRRTLEFCPYSLSLFFNVRELIINIIAPKFMDQEV